MASLSLTVAAWDDRVFSVVLDEAEALATLQAILEAESGVPAAQQALIHNGRPLPPSAGGQSLKALGIASGDMLMLMPAAPQAGQQQAARAPAQQQQQQQAAHPQLELAADGSAKAPVAFIQAVKGNPAMLDQITASNPALGSAIRNEDISAMQAELRSLRSAQHEREAALSHERELLEADPFDPDVQRRIEQLIQKQNIEENLAAALEHNPEVFGSVEMLYVDMEVNGVPVKAFVDSGAQMTIMTHDFAEKCFLTRLLDKRFAGMAVGVGSSRILGRIHQAPLKVAGHFTTCSITVLEQREGPQFIFGLDMLKRHQCVLDMQRQELRFNSCEATLGFLPDHLIPKDFKRHIEEVSKAQAEKNVEEARDGSASGAAAAGAAGAGSSGTAALGFGPQAMDATPAPPAAAALPPPAAAAATAPAAPPASAAPAGGGPAAEAAVQQLVGLGFAKDVAERALQAAGGNVDAAASMLFGM